MTSDSVTPPPDDRADSTGAALGPAPSEAGHEDDPARAHEWLCGTCPLRSPQRSRTLLTGLSPAPTVAQARRSLSVSWVPFTARVRGRATLVVRSADFRPQMSHVLRFVQCGDMRVVLLRQRLPLAAIVPLPDFWFLLQVEEELRRLGWSAHRRHPRPEAIARAIIALQPADSRPSAGRADAHPQKRESAPWLTFDGVDALRGRR